MLQKLIALFAISLPPLTALQGHPLFLLETRHQRWMRSSDQYRRMGFRYFAPLPLIGLVLGIILYLSESGRSSALMPPTVSTNLVILLTLWAGTLMAGLAFDALATLSGFFSLHREWLSGRYDLLRLTPLTSSSLVNAKSALGQARLWRWAALLAGLRLALLIMTFMAWSAWFAGAFVGGSLLTALWVGSLVAVLWIIEPFLRLPMLTALGLLIAARSHRTATGVVITLAAMVGIWLVTAVLLGLAGNVIVRVGITALLCLAPFIALSINQGLRSLYQDMTRSSIQIAVRWLAQADA